jgi:PKD repeat protein
MNEIVLNTFDPAWPVHDLVTGWYDDDFVAGVFNSSYLPEGWRPESSETIPANAGAIYEKVIAQNCRACHTQKNSSEQRTPSFATYQSFADSQDAIMQIVFEHGAMPFARLTYDRFWVGAGQSAGDFLADTLAAGAARPGNPIACIADPTTAVCIRNGFMRSTTNLSEIRLDGRGSQFAASYNWTLLTRPSGSNATLTGADTAEPAFVIDVPGTYEVQLTVNNAAGLADEARVEVIASSVVPTRIGKPELAVGEGNSRTIDSSLLEYTDPDNNPAELIFEVVSAPAHGNVVPELFTQLDLNMGTVSYSHDGSESSADNFFFSLSDGTTVLENQPFPITITPVNDLPLLFSNVQLMLNEGDSAKVSSSNLSYTDADGDELVYTVTRSPMFGSLDPLSFTETDLVMDAGPIYQHDGTENFSDNFDYSVSDGIAAVTGRFEIEIAPISDTPLLTINPLTVMEDSAATVITTGTLNAADVDNTPPELLLTVIDTPDHGTLSRLSFTQQDIIDGLLTYIPALNYFGPDGLTIMVEDPGGSTDTGTLNITVVAEDDVPTLMANNPLLAYLGAEEVPIESSNLRFSDVDTEESGLNYTITGGPSIGTLSTDRFTQSDIDEGRVTYSGTGATVDDQSTTFNFSVSDGTTPVVGTFTINFFASCLFNVNPIWASRNCTNCHTSTHVDGFVLTGTSIANCDEIRTHQTMETVPDQNIVNTASPSASYLLRKSLGELSHGGGIRFLSTDDLDYKMILRWIEEGAENN